MGGCRRILRLDGCFLKHTCKGHLVTTIESASRRRERNVQYASAKCRGRGSKCGDRGAMVVESGGIGQMGAECGGRAQMDVESYGRGGIDSGIRAMGTHSGGRGRRSDGRETMHSVIGRRGGAKGRRGSGRGGRRDDTGKSMEDKHMQGLLVEQENLRQKQEKEQQDNLDEEALHQAREEDLMFKIMDLEREREKQQYEAMMDPLNYYKFPHEEESMDVEMYNITKASKKVKLQVFNLLNRNMHLLKVQVFNLVHVYLQVIMQQRRKEREQGVNQMYLRCTFQNISQKNRGRLGRIRNIQEKKFKFDAQGT
nr:hypothetical protein [Tanacetum cinerariifolium]